MQSQEGNEEINEEIVVNRALKHVFPEDCGASQLRVWIACLEQDRDKMTKELAEELSRIQESVKRLDQDLSDKPGYARELSRRLAQAQSTQSSLAQYDAAIKIHQVRLEEFLSSEESGRAQSQAMKHCRNIRHLIDCAVKIVATPEEIKAVRITAARASPAYSDDDGVGFCLRRNREIAVRAICLISEFCDKKDAIIEDLVNDSDCRDQDPLQL
jgi:transposase-like protein